MRSLFWLTEVRHIALTKSVEKFRLGAYMVKGCEGKSTQKKMLSETPGSSYIGLEEVVQSGAGWKIWRGEP